MRKTKIIATMGPNLEKEIVEKMVLTGLNAIRLNMSHGTYDEHRFRIEQIRQINEELNTNVGIILDTKGPEIRLGEFKDGKALLVEGTLFTITTKDIIGDETKASISYKKVIKDVKVGMKILLSDGLVMLTVNKIKSDFIECIVNNTGLVKSKKGVNIPEAKLSIEFLTKQDKEDIAFGVKNDVDYVAASFVRCKEDVISLRNYIDKLGGKRIKIIAKIENEEGINNLQEIISVSDGIMVARGDMGVEVALERLPSIQKKIIKSCIESGKIVITATQMLESMVSNPRPTRAEVTDVANAIYDGTTAIMLSAETAVGEYPVECIQIMDKIAVKTEEDIDYWNRFKKRNVEKLGAYIKESEESKSSLRKQINFAVCSSAMFTDAKAIISVSDYGKTPTILASYRPSCPIYVFTNNKKTYSLLSLEWGIHCIYTDKQDFEDIVNSGIDKLKKDNILKKDDIVILGGGTTKTDDRTSYLSSQTMGAVLRV